MTCMCELPGGSVYVSYLLGGRRYMYSRCAAQASYMHAYLGNVADAVTSRRVVDHGFWYSWRYTRPPRRYRPGRRESTVH